MGWYPNYDGQDMGPSLDRWITGNYGADEYSGDHFCSNCAYCDGFDGGMGTCVNPHSPFSDEDVDAEGFCDWWEAA